MAVFVCYNTNDYENLCHSCSIALNYKQMQI